MDALKQSLKGKASAKRAAHSPAAAGTARRPAKKAHRSAARARKAGDFQFFKTANNHNCHRPV